MITVTAYRQQYRSLHLYGRSVPSADEKQSKRRKTNQIMVSMAVNEENGTSTTIANQCNAILMYGRRRVKPDMLAVFKQKFAAHAANTVAADSKVKAFFAFPDCSDLTTFYHVFMSTGCTKIRGDVLTGEGLAALYSSTAGNPDVFEVYGGWTHEVAADAASSVRYRLQIPCTTCWVHQR